MSRMTAARLSGIDSTFLSQIEAELVDEIRACWRERADNWCDVCAGTGNLPSGKPCICGGTGRECDTVVGFRKALYRSEQKNAALCEQIRVLRERLPQLIVEYANAEIDLVGEDQLPAADRYSSFRKPIVDRAKATWAAIEQALAATESKPLLTEQQKSAYAKAIFDNDYTELRALKATKPKEQR